MAFRFPYVYRVIHMYHTRTPKSHFLPGRCRCRRDRSVTGDVRNIHLTSCKKTVKLIFSLVFPPPGGSRPSREVARWFSDDTLLLPTTDSNTDGITSDHLSSDLRPPACTPAVVCFTFQRLYKSIKNIPVFFLTFYRQKSDVFSYDSEN